MSLRSLVLRLTKKSKPGPINYSEKVSYHGPAKVSVGGPGVKNARYLPGGGFPNPFGGKAKIDFHLAQPGRVNLPAYNIAGQLVRTLVDGDRPAGRGGLFVTDGDQRSPRGEKDDLPAGVEPSTIWDGENIFAAPYYFT